MKAVVHVAVTSLVWTALAAPGSNAHNKARAKTRSA